VRFESGRHRTAEKILRTKHVVAAGLFAGDAGSTPAASTSSKIVEKRLTCCDWREWFQPVSSIIFSAPRGNLLQRMAWRKGTDPKNESIRQKTITTFKSPRPKKNFLRLIGRGSRHNSVHPRQRVGAAQPEAGMDKTRTISQHEPGPQTNSLGGSKKWIRSPSTTMPLTRNCKQRSTS